MEPHSLQQSEEMEEFILCRLQGVTYHQRLILLDNSQRLTEGVALKVAPNAADHWESVKEEPIYFFHLKKGANLENEDLSCNKL